MTYTLLYEPIVVKKHIPALPKKVRTLVKTAIEDRLSFDPIGYGKPLRYSLKSHRRLRVGDYRIVYRVVPDTHSVIIIAILHRKEIYETL